MKSIFTTHPLSDADILQASVLSPLQVQNIQNIIASYAAERVTRIIDTEKIMATVQADARTLGMIEALQYLLDTSESAISHLKSTPSEGS